MILNTIKKSKYLNILKEETNDNLFLEKVDKMLQKISNCNKDVTDEKINSHFKKIQNVFLNKSSNDIEYLETKKMAYNYHLYLLEEYYDKIYSTLFFEKSSN